MNYIIPISILSTILAIVDRTRILRKFTKVRPLFFSLLIFSIVGMIGLIQTNDFFTLFIFQELVFLPAYVWGNISKGNKFLKVTLRYLIVGILGSVLMLMGICLLYGLTGTLEIGQIQAHALPLVLIFAGLGLKSGILPLNLILPNLYKTTNSAMGRFFSAFMLVGSTLPLSLISLRILNSVEFSAGVIVLAIITWFIQFIRN